MSGVVDISGLLQSWPYDPDNDARLVEAQGGREVLQVRLPLGIEQYELEGRPDGLRPHDAESYFDYQLARFAEAQSRGTGSSFELSPEECAELFNEGTLYYFRYLRLFQLKDWARTARDTARNLRVFDFVHRHAAEEDDQMYLEQWRPYILRMHAVAQVMLELDKGRYTKALNIAERAASQIEDLPESDDETFQVERERSLTSLRELASELRKNRPLSELELLERELHRAVESEHFERAAELRDRIRTLRQSPRGK